MEEGNEDEARQDEERRMETDRGSFSLSLFLSSFLSLLTPLLVLTLSPSVHLFFSCVYDALRRPLPCMHCIFIFLSFDVAHGLQQGRFYNCTL